MPCPINNTGISSVLFGVWVSLSISLWFMAPLHRSWPGVFDEGAGAIFFEGDLQFALGVHDDRAIPGDRFTDGASGDEQKANRFVLGRNDDLFSVVEQDQEI